MNHITPLIISLFIFMRCEANFTLSNVVLPQAMGYHYTAIYNGTFTVFAGENSEDYITTSQSSQISYKLDVNPWTLNNVSLPLDMQGLAVHSDTNVNINGKVYIINQENFGGSGSSYQQLLTYDLATNKYTVWWPMPLHRVQNTCTVYNSKYNIIYTIGGYTTFGGGQTTKYTQRYYVGNHTYSDGADTVNAKYLAGCTVDATNEYIYYFGGYYCDGSGNCQALDEIQKYTVSNDNWTVNGVLSATLSVARRGLKCRLLSTDSNIYCIGGDTPGMVYNTVDVFDPSTETIVDTIYLNVARTFFSAIMFNSDACIIVSGGDIGDYTYLDSIETFGDCIAPTETPSAAPSKSPNDYTNNPSTIPTKNPTKATMPGNKASIRCVSMTIVICIIGLIGS